MVLEAPLHDDVADGCTLARDDSPGVFAMCLYCDHETVHSQTRAQALGFGRLHVLRHHRHQHRETLMAMTLQCQMSERREGRDRPVRCSRKAESRFWVDNAHTGEDDFIAVCPWHAAYYEFTETDPRGPGFS